MKLVVAALLTGGSVITGAPTPNPNPGECVFWDVVVTRSEPTLIDPEGAVTGLRIWQQCGIQVPNGDGVYNSDDIFITDVDLAQAELLASVADDLLSDDGVYLPE